MDARPQLRTIQDIEAWMVEQVAAELGIDPQEIDVHKPLIRYGLDSMSTVVLAGDLEDILERPLPSNLLGEYTTIEALAKHLASELPVSESSSAEELPPSNSNAIAPVAGDQPRLRWQAFFSKVIVFLLRLITRMRIEGLENLPASGPYILAGNHLNMIDPALIYCVLPKGAGFLVAEDMRRKWPIIEWVMKQLGPAIYVSRGGADRDAVSRAVAFLRAGGILAMAPEGKVSRTGGLLQGRTGIAYLATEAGVPILPVVAFGQEKANKFWKRLRRVPVNIRIGPLIELPAGKAGAGQLEPYTGKIMVAMARLLPPQYRGVYEQAAQEDR